MKIKKIHGYQRFIVVFVAFLGVINTYLMRNTLGLIMTKLNPKTKSVEFTFEKQYKWSSKLESAIHASFYFGYVIGHIPGSYLAERYGGKVVLNIGLFSTAIFTIITPVIIEQFAAYGLIVMRVLMGLGEAGAFPALGKLLSAWIPKSERVVLSAFVLGGVQMGSLLSSLLSGEILHDTKGWGIVFFVVGIVGVAWNILFHFTVSDKPETHPRISDEEKEYLKNEIGELAKTRHLSNVPWTSLLTSKPVLALIIAQLGHDWALFFMGSYIPKYLKNSVKLTFKEAGRYGALAYFIAWIFSIFSGTLGGYLITRKVLSITWSRKVFTVISTFFPGLFIVLASYTDSMALAVTWIILSMGTMGAFYAGNRVNVLDICPNYTASLLGLVNGLGAIGGIIALFSTGLLTPNQTIEEWRVVFWISFAVLMATTFVYLIWASGEVQSWNDNTSESNWLSRLLKRKGAKVEGHQTARTQSKTEQMPDQ